MTTIAVENLIVVERRDGQFEVARITHNRAFVRVRYTRAELEQLVALATKALNEEER